MRSKLFGAGAAKVIALALLTSTAAAPSASGPELDPGCV